MCSKSPFLLENNHIPQEDLELLVYNLVDNTKRIDILDHLACCDDCMDRYLEILEDTSLEPVPERLSERILTLSLLEDPCEDLTFTEELSPSVEEEQKVVPISMESRMNKKSWQIVKCAVAAAITLVLWGSGFFLNMVQLETPNLSTAMTKTDTFFQKSNEGIFSWCRQGIDSFYNFITGGDGKHENKK